MFKLKKERVTLKKIDSGASGHVYPYQKDADDLKWVVKRIPVNDADELLTCLPEIVLGFSCDHPCIVPLKGYHIEKRSEGDYFVYLKFPRMEENLKNRFEDHQRKKAPFSEQEIVQYFYALVSAVEYLHTKKIYHRDIKPANVLLDHQGKAKLSDVGVAKYIGEEETCQQLTDKKGTIDYTAPEILQEKGKLTKENLRVNDLWSVGLVVLELCALEKRIVNPYSGSEKIQEVLGKLEKKLKGIYSERLIDLVLGLLKVDPHERMGIEDVKRILGEEYRYCRDLERGSERYECEVLKEEKKILGEKFNNKAQEMMALAGALKEDNVRIKNELREYWSFVVNMSQRLCEYSGRFGVRSGFLDHKGFQKNEQNREFQSELKPIQSLDESSQPKQSIRIQPEEEKGESSSSPRKEEKLRLPFMAKINLFGPNGAGKTIFLAKSDRWQILDQDKKVLETDLLAVSQGKFSIKGPINECDVLLMLYDITDKESFSYLQTKIKREDLEGRKPILFLLGTSLELESQRRVTKIEAEGFAKECGAIYFEISEETGENIEQFREELTKAVFAKYKPSLAGVTGKKAVKTEKNR